MKQWEVRKFPFQDEGEHWAVILSNDERCGNNGFATVNALYCQTFRPANRALKPNEVMLDKADGFDWKTVVRCDVIYLLEKVKFGESRGVVTPTRRREISRALAFCLRLPSPWA